MIATAPDVMVTPFGHLHPTARLFEPCVVLRPEQVVIGADSRVDSFCKIEGGELVEIGRRVHVCSFAHLNIGGGRLTVEDGATIASGARLLSGSNTRRGMWMNTLSPSSEHHVERRHTSIGEGAFVGANAVVLPGVRVGCFAVVGAGAVVTRDVPDFEVWVGVPARRLCDRRDPGADDFWAGSGR